MVWRNENNNKMEENIERLWDLCSKVKRYNKRYCVICGDFLGYGKRNKERQVCCECRYKKENIWVNCGIFFFRPVRF